MSNHKRRPLFNRKGPTANGAAFLKELKEAVQPVIHKWMRHKGYARESVHSLAITAIGFAILNEQLNLGSENKQ